MTTNYIHKKLDEKDKYGANMCKVCKQRKVVDWNTYNDRQWCSEDCKSKLIVSLLIEANKAIGAAL